MSQHSKQLDVAIIGGGISGIYSGWRLLTSSYANSPMLRSWASAPGRNGKLSVGLFESSHRIGGRLLSAKPPGMEDTVCELGGMRYVSSQTLVRSLIENKLKLPRHHQVVDVPQNIANLRGQHLRMSETTDPAKLPYNIDDAEKAYLKHPHDPSGLMGWAITKLLPEVPNLHGSALRKYLQAAQINGVDLYQYGFWNLLAPQLSFEAYQLSKAMIGYDCLGNNANAVDLTTCYFDFTPDVQYYLIDGGYETVPWMLEERFIKAGGDVHFNSLLESFDQVTLDDGTLGVSLHFRDGRATVKARSIILAMPQHSIQRLRPTGPVLDPDRAPAVQRMLGSVEPIPLYKLFIGYNKPWWQNVGVTEGRSFTDLPVRQCYYWANNQAPNPDPSATNSMIMVYDDSTNVDFWAGLRISPQLKLGHLPQHTTPPVFQRKSPSSASPAASSTRFEHHLKKNWTDHEAPRLLVDETHRQLMLLHNVTDAPEPVEAAYADWCDEPYGGAVHFWNRGFKSWEIVDNMTQPVPDFPCYVCGEAYSTNQTWAEGALETAEIVLQKRFQLSEPDWITAASTAAAG